MARYKENKFLSDLKNFLVESIPNQTDNISRIIVKIIFFLCIIGIVSSCIYSMGYFGKNHAERKIINQEREMFSLEYGNLLLKQENNDFVAWIKIENTEVNNPIYQTNDNEYYLNHNALGKKSDYGTLFLDCNSDFSDRNIVVYGNTKEDGSLFSTLHEYRKINFIRENPIITLTKTQEDYNYRVFAVFVIDSNKDRDTSFNVCQKDFSSNKIFKKWITEAKTRSFVQSSIDVNIEDEYLTLITSCDDFDGARLVVMARRLREGETSTKSYKYAVNKNPKFPKKWYDDRNINYPF